MSHSFALYFIGGLNELTVLQRVDIFVHFKFDKISLGYFPHYLFIYLNAVPELTFSNSSSVFVAILPTAVSLLTLCALQLLFI